MIDQDNKLHGRAHLAAALARYARRHPSEAACADRFRRFVEEEPRCYERDCWRGHVTGAVWLVDGSGERALLTHHRKLNMWLQLGGHSDGDPDTTAVALREAREESGLVVELLDTDIFDIDIHAIPARDADPGHEHFDVRLLARAVGSEAFVVSEESHDLAWVPHADIRRYTQESTILRMTSKWLALRT
ncbi:MAG: NUDIX hydrolase [Pseudomonadota bacterium]